MKRSLSFKNIVDTVDQSRVRNLNVLKVARGKPYLVHCPR